MPKPSVKFEQINRWQDPRQNHRREVEAVLGNNLATAEALFKDAEPEEQAWLRHFTDLIKTGQRQSTSYGGNLNELAMGAVIPSYVQFDLKKFFGEDSRFTFEDRTDTWNKKGPFNLKTITTELGCNREQAATLLALIILLRTKYEIVDVLRHPEGLVKGDTTINVAGIQALFRNEGFINAVTNRALEASLPLLAEHLSVRALHQLLDRLKIFKFEPNQARLQQVFATPARQRAFAEVFRTGVHIGLEILPSYEYLFSELTREQFLEFFPDWHTTPIYQYRRYIERYNLRPPRQEFQPQAPAITEPTEPLVAESNEPPNEARRSTPGWRRRALQWGAAALVLLGAGHFLRQRSEKPTPPEAVAADTAEPRTNASTPSLESNQHLYTYIPSLEPRSDFNSNNLAIEQTTEQLAEKNFVAEPAFHGMLATDVFTTIEPHGHMRYERKFAFTTDPDQFDDNNSRRHIVAERVPAQGKILYPPELGSIEPTSIYIDGYEANEYDVIRGDQGRYLVKLKKPADKPFKIVYVMRAAFGAMANYYGERPNVPEINNPDLAERSEFYGLERYPHEDALTFALRAETTIRQRYRYPETGPEKYLSFDSAISQFIGDCDVANQDLLAVLQRNNIAAELVADLHPVPGELQHGQVRAIVFSAESQCDLVIKLDATPQPLVAASERLGTTRKLTHSFEQDQELQNLIQQYQAEHDVQTGNDRLIAPGSMADIARDIEPTRDFKMQVLTEPNSEQMSALRRGVYGYAEYMLRQRDLLPRAELARIRLISELMVQMLSELQSARVIPAEADPYDWSKHIGLKEARQLIGVIDQSSRIKSIIDNLTE